MDIIKQMTEGVAAMLAKIIFRKTESKEFFIEQQMLEPIEVNYLLSALISEGLIDEAENTLFEQFELAPSTELYETGIAMYERLAAMTDAELEAHNFPRTEVVRGLADFQSLRQGKILF